MNSASCSSVMRRELADLDAAELAGAEQVVDLVAADVEHLGDLLDGVCLQGHHLLRSRVVPARLLSFGHVG